MNRLNIPNPSNGIKAFWDDLEYLLGIADFASDENSGGIIQFLESFLNEIGGGADFIVSGCVGSFPITAGYIFLGGELLKVPEHTRTNDYFEKITVNPTEGDRIDAAGTSVSIYDQYTAKCTAAAGTLQYTGDRLDDVLLDYLDLSNTTYNPQTSFIGSHGSISFAAGISRYSLNQSFSANCVTLDERGNINLELNITRDADTRSAVCTLPTAFRPMTLVAVNSFLFSTGGAAGGAITVNTDGTVVISTGDTYLNISAKVSYSRY